MSKTILTLSFLLILFYSSTLPLSAAGTNLSLSPDKKFAYLGFSDLKNVSRIAYTLTYQTAGRTTGVESGFKTFPRTTRSTRRQILGTCSTRFCTYHQNPRGFKLTVTYYLRSGGSTTVTKTLP